MELDCIEHTIQSAMDWRERRPRMKVNINAGLPSLRSRATSCKYTRLTWVRDSVVNYCFPSLSLSLSFVLQESSTPFLDSFISWSEFLGEERICCSPLSFFFFHPRGIEYPFLE